MLAGYIYLNSSLKSIAPPGPTDFEATYALGHICQNYFRKKCKCEFSVFIPKVTICVWNVRTWFSMPPNGKDDGGGAGC